MSMQTASLWRSLDDTEAKFIRSAARSVAYTPPFFIVAQVVRLGLLDTMQRSCLAANFKKRILNDWWKTGSGKITMKIYNAATLLLVTFSMGCFKMTWIARGKKKHYRGRRSMFGFSPKRNGIICRWVQAFVWVAMNGFFPVPRCSTRLDYNESLSNNK